MDPAAAAAVADAHRRDWGFVLAATARITRDLDAAEDCVQDAYAQALAAWPASGVPATPAAWLTVVARRRAMNLIRRNDTLARKLPLLAGAATLPGPGDGDGMAADAIPDDRLRLIFTCCRPALATEARVALSDGLALIRAALEQRPPTRYALMAAIAAVHAAAPRWEATDWQQVTGLYDALTQIWPSPVVALSRAIAIGGARGPQAGLTMGSPGGEAGCRRARAEGWVTCG